MSSEIIVNDSVPSFKANILPFQIQYTGEANTEDYFAPSKRPIDGNNLEAQFRGIKVIGHPVELRSSKAYILSHSEHLVQDPSNPEEVKTAKQYTSVGRINDITLYGHDTLPPLNSKWELLQEWDSVSSAIHS